MQNLKTFFEGLKRGGNSGFKLGKSPENDWKIIVISALILIALVIVLSFYMFLSVSKEDVFVSEGTEDGSGAALEIQDLRDFSSYYQNKAAEFEKIKAGTSTPITDPSI